MNDKTQQLSREHLNYDLIYILLARKQKNLRCLSLKMDIFPAVKEQNLLMLWDHPKIPPGRIMHDSDFNARVNSKLEHSPGTQNLMETPSAQATLSPNLTIKYPSQKTNVSIVSIHRFWKIKCSIHTLENTAKFVEILFVGSVLYSTLPTMSSGM